MYISPKHAGPLILTCIVEIIGFAARAACTNATADLISYCIQSVFILLGPVLFAASIYMVLARLIRSVGAEKYSLIRITWVTRTFVSGDILSFLVQGNGSGMMATESLKDVAKGIVIGGLLIQILVFGFFIVTCVVFEMRMKRAPTPKALSGEVNWKNHLYPLYTVSGLIMVRSIFRTIEYGMGKKGYLLSHEWPMYVLDSVLMVGVMGVWGYWHPGTIGKEGNGRLSLVRMVSSRSKAESGC